jgi:hypothetical protein
VKNTWAVILRGIIALNRGSRGNRISRGIGKGRGKKGDSIRGKA